MGNPQVKLGSRELDCSLDFIEKHGSSIFFPQPFEVNAIRASWNKIRPILQRIDLLNYEASPAYEIMAPKQKYSFRPIHLLDPIDNILFTGLIHRIAPSIESKRVTASKQIVNSYRMSMSPSGELILINDWSKHEKAIRKRIRKYKMVLKADIVDFFPRVYHHRLENAIRDITGLEYETRSLMRMIVKWSNGTSYGIPVGPLASNIIAEALLIEVDDYLLSQKMDFIRWIDDYLIFGNTRSDCYKYLTLLATRLQKSQGLSLNMSKTRILTCSSFLAELDNKKDPIKKQRKTIIRVVFKGDPYRSIKYSDLTKEQKQLMDALNVKETMKNALVGDLVDLETIRFVLNVLSAMRRPELVDIILENLPSLFPVSDAVARFLNVFDSISASKRNKIGEKILNYLIQESYVPDFQALWLLEPFTNSSKWNHLDKLRNIAGLSQNEFVIRQAVLALGQVGNRSALLDLKYRINQSTNWVRRAILYSCRKLPYDERGAFYKSVNIPVGSTTTELLEKAIIDYCNKSP